MVLDYEIRRGEDAEIIIETIKGDFSGEEETAITNMALWVRGYKDTSATLAEGSTIVRDTDMGLWILTVPKAFIPTGHVMYGVLKGDNIEDAIFKVWIARMKTITSYTHNATAQTLDTGMTDLKLTEILEIWNLTRHLLIYDYRNPQANKTSDHDIGIQVSNGVIHYDYTTDNKADADEIMINVNM